MFDKGIDMQTRRKNFISHDFFYSLNICSLFHAPVCNAWLAIYYLKHWQVRGRVGYVTLLTFFHYSMEYGCLDYRYYENVTLNLVFVPLVSSLFSRSLKFRNSFTLKFQIIFDIYIPIEYQISLLLNVKICLLGIYTY